MNRRKQYIERLAEVLTLNPNSERHLAMFSAYLDESGKGNERHTFLAVGALVSSALQWGRLQAEWNRHLLLVPDMPIDDQGRPVPFHMTDFERGAWPVKDYQWKSGAAEVAFLNGLLAIMCARIKLRVFTVVWLDHFHALRTQDRKDKLPWVVSAIGCQARIAAWSKSKAYDNVPLIFEAGGEGWGLAFDNYNGLERQGRREIVGMGSWTLANKHVAGLQAADLWAWELRKHFQSQTRAVSRMPLRESLTKLLCGIQDGGGFVLGGSDLRALMNNLASGSGGVPSVSFTINSIPVVNQDVL